MNAFLARLVPRRDLLGREHPTDTFKSCIKIIISQLPLLITTVSNPPVRVHIVLHSLSKMRTVQTSLGDAPSFGMHRIANLEFFVVPNSKWIDPLRGY